LGHLKQGHAEAYRAIHAERPEARVSLNTYTADYTLGFEGAGPVEAIMRSLTSDAELAEAALEEVTMDYASFDYYCRLRVGIPFELPRPDRWEVSPRGFYDALRRYHDICRLPILVAENGMATWDLNPRDDGWTRAAYLAAHVHQLQQAMADGVPVIGYVHWSITDNYEWGSFGPRFGLYSVDCRNQDFTRSPTDGVDAYRAIIANGGVPSALLASLPFT
jgi:beta-glucosidase